MRINKKYVIILTILTAVILVLISAFLVFDNQPEDYILSETTNSINKIEYNGKTYIFNSNLKTVLVIGADGNAEDPLAGQADFISLIVINEKEDKASFLIIPRDTLTKIDVCDQDGKVLDTTISHINMSYPQGGNTHYYMALNTRNAVSNLLNGIQINNYISMPVTILEDFVDVFDEGDVYLKDDSLSYLDSNLVAGSIYHIDKESIELYLRSRDVETDFSAENRTNRHIMFLEYFIDKLKGLSKNDQETKLDQLGGLLSKCETNITSKQLNIYYNSVLSEINNNQEIIVIPGRYQMGLFYDEFHYDGESLKDLIVRLFYKEA